MSIVFVFASNIAFAFSFLVELNSRSMMDIAAARSVVSVAFSLVWECVQLAGVPVDWCPIGFSICAVATLGKRERLGGLGAEASVWVALTLGVCTVFAKVTLFSAGLLMWPLSMSSI